jgi:DNA polymerase elongation subunit (family B)
MCHFEDLEIVGIVYQKAAVLMKKYFEKLNEFKNEYKEQKEFNKVESFKRLMNSPYGKTGQKPYEFNYYLDNNIVKELPIAGDEIKYAMVSTAGYITQQGRVNLLKPLKKILDNGGKFLYGDTDSLTVVINNKIDVHDFLKIDNIKLGA